MSASIRDRFPVLSELLAHTARPGAGTVRVRCHHPRLSTQLPARTSILHQPLRYLAYHCTESSCFNFPIQLSGEYTFPRLLRCVLVQACGIGVKSVSTPHSCEPPHNGGAYEAANAQHFHLSCLSTALRERRMNTLFGKTRLGIRRRAAASRTI